MPPSVAHGIDLLSFLAACRTDPDLVGYFNAAEALRWVWRRIHELRGIPLRDLVEATGRLAHVDPFLAALDGWAEQPWAGLYGQGQKDLTHVAKALREMDKDGDTQEIGRELFRRYPILREVHAELHRFAILRAWARRNLKGMQLAAVELLCANDGRVTIADLAVVCEWNDQTKGFENLRYVMNEKFDGAHLPFTLSRCKDVAVLTREPPRPPLKNPQK